MLEVVTKRSAGPLSVLINSAVANAKNNFNIEKEGLVIRELRVDAGAIMKRRMPRARGNSYPINKRTSHVNLVLDVKPETKVKEVKAKVKTEKK
jgi:large subunit ribosomal protein L22